MASVTHSTCPVVRNEVMRLFDCVEVGGKQKYLPFEQRILWIRESTAAVVMVHRGIQLKEFGSWNDWCGYLTSVVQARKEADEQKHRYGIVPGDALRIQVNLSVSEIPVLEDLSREGIEWNKDAQRRQYRNVPSYYDGNKWWYTSDLPLEPDEKFSPRPRLEAIEIWKMDRVYCTTDGYLGEAAVKELWDAVAQFNPYRPK